MKIRLWYPMAIVALMVIASIVAGQRMPDRVVTHYDFAGRPNAHGSKYTILLVVPLIALFMCGFVWMVRAFVTSQVRGNYVAAVFDRVVNLALTVFLALHVSILARTLGYPVALEHFAPAMIGLILIAVGRMLPGLPRNYLVGVRTPWTLRSDRVWERSQIVGARLMTAAGVVSVAASVLPMLAGFVVAVAAALGAAIGVTVYSYMAWKQEGESSR